MLLLLHGRTTRAAAAVRGAPFIITIMDDDVCAVDGRDHLAADDDEVVAAAALNIE